MNITLSVLVITYNQENFIRKTLESILEQKTNFSIEVVIGEDCSKDKTRSICEEFKSNFPNLFNLLPSDKNYGMIANFRRTLDNCKGKYIAICEGDDYWIDSNKLQKQVDFLESNPRFVSCFHNTWEINENNMTPPFLYCPIDQLSNVKTEDLIVKGNIIPTCSNVFKANIVRPLPKWINKLGMGDWPLNLILSKNGEIGYINDIMGVHRLHSGGIWSGNSELSNQLISLDAFKAFKKNIKLSKPLLGILKNKIIELELLVLDTYINSKHRRKSIIYALKLIYFEPFTYMSNKVFFNLIFRIK